MTASSLDSYISTHSSFQNPQSPSSPLPALYSDLSRQRKSNPAGFRASIEWWKDILLDVTFSGLQSGSTPSTDAEAVDRTIFRLDEGTKARWTVEGVGRPLGLGTVVGELERDRTVVGLNAYLKSTAAIAGPSSGFRQYLTVGGVAYALLMPARWAATSIVSAVVGSADEDDQDEALFRAKRGEWVFYPLVHRIATTFVSAFYATEASSPLSFLMSAAEFQHKLADVCVRHYGFAPSARDAEVVLKYLSRDHSPRLLVSQAGLVKLSPSETESVEAIMDEDRSVIAVKETLRKLELQITSLEEQIAHRTQQITAALRSNNKPQAASYLRSRKALQEVLAKRVAVKANLDQVVGKIEQAKTDVDVLRAYRASQEVLRSVLGRDEMRVEEVERTMDGLQEVLEQQREVEEVMKVGEVDEDEVMVELRALEVEAEKEREGGREREREAREKEARENKQHDDLQARFERLRVAESPLPTTPTSTVEHNTDPSKADNAAERNTPSQQPVAE